MRAYIGVCINWNF